MAVDLDEFIKRLDDSGVLAADTVRSFCEHLPEAQRPQDGEALARALVKDKKLTSFQANLVYQGKTKNLVLGPYLVLDKIGEGGMGQVFKAEHRRMHRIVAVKVLPASLTRSKDAVDRFQREVQAAARLDHQNIVTAYDANEANGVHFLAMQFVDGRDLAATVADRGKLPVPEALNYIIQAARGLGYAHDHGVIHRDIKPANLLVDKDGVVKILDMGLARLDDAASGADGLTRAGQVMGTLDYMAPEQSVGMNQVDRRADIYSLGCTLYKILTNENMFAGETPIAKVMAHREAPIPSLRAKRPDVSEAVDAVYRRMVAKRPEDRYPSMKEVVTELERCQGTGTVLLPPPVTAVAPPVAVSWQTPTATMVAPGTSMYATQAAPTTERQPHFMFKVMGAVFVTIVAPLMVTIFGKYTDAIFPAPATPPTATTSAATPPSPSRATSQLAPAPASHTAPPTPTASKSNPPGATAPRTMPPVPAPPATTKKPNGGDQVATATSNKPPVAPPKPPADLPPPLRLFNARDLGGFYTMLPKPAGKNNDPDKVFKVRGNTLHISGAHRGMLVTDRPFDNYHLTVEWKWGENNAAPHENEARAAGILLHGQGPDDAIQGTFLPSIKIDVHEGHTGDFVLLGNDDHKPSISVEGELITPRGAKPGLQRFHYRPGLPLSTFSTGAVWGLNASIGVKHEKGYRGKDEMEAPFDKWNKLECICRGNRIEVLLNDKPVNVAQQVHPIRGKIALQSVHSEFHVRSIMLQPLK
ncbi:MAG: protein kinase [Planctomycetes bacterium]|nr:protein kinase [Planctomycetota bacterium]